MTRLDDMTLLLAVVDHGSFSAAARALGQTPSAVGKRVAQLEARLGVALLHRSTRRMALTAAGRRYAEGAREILARLAALDDDIAAGSDSLRGAVRMTAPIAFGRAHVAPAVIAFARAHPGVEIVLSLTDRAVDLVGEGFDLAVRTGVPVASGLIARRVAGYRRRICAAPGYLATRGVPERPRDLARHRCLKLAQEWQPGDWGLAAAGGPALRLGPGLRCNALDVLHMACLAGEGLACLPEVLCEGDMRAGRLHPVLGDCAAAEQATVAILRPEGTPPRRVRVLGDFLVAHLRRAGDAEEGR